MLYGDSGERDPDVFRFIKQKFPEQIVEIHIRDVVCESLKTKPNEIDGDDGILIDVVNADTSDADAVTRGVTRFKD